MTEAVILPQRQRRPAAAQPAPAAPKPALRKAESAPVASGARPHMSASDFLSAKGTLKQVAAKEVAAPPPKSAQGGGLMAALDKAIANRRGGAWREDYTGDLAFE